MSLFHKVLHILVLLTGLLQQAYAEPLANFDFNSGTEGASITEFSKVSAPLKSAYSSEVESPTGGGLVMRIHNETGNKTFGGRIVDLDLGEGDEVWVRWYQYFPNGFKFANGTNGDANGGAGRLKWMRFQYSGNSDRITFEIDATGSCAAPCNFSKTQMQAESIIGEAQNWKERYGNQMISLDMPAETARPTAQWHSIQMYMKLSTGSADLSDGDGLIRLWVDDHLVGEYQRNTLPISGSSNLKSIWLGNYWNGGFPADQHFYVDDIIITNALPATLDSLGNPYIAPNNVQLVSPPMPPSNIQVILSP